MRNILAVLYDQLLSYYVAILLYLVPHLGTSPKRPRSSLVARAGGIPGLEYY